MLNLDITYTVRNIIHYYIFQMYGVIHVEQKHET